MNKTLKQMQQDSKLCACFVYVLDARCPKSCINPEFVKVIKDKPIIYVLNKADLVDPADINQVKQYFKKIGAGCVSIDATKSNSTKVIVDEIKRVFSLRLKQNQQKGVNFIIRAMILGVPNSGKSTIVNNLSKKASAVVGNRAGVTKSKQWIRLNNVEFMDTPGVLLPNFSDEQKAYNLAFVGSVKDEVLNFVDLATRLIIKLNQNYSAAITTRYGVDSTLFTQDISTTQAHTILEAIGKKRGCIVSGGHVDLDRAAHILISDFRLGKLGKICLEN